MSTTDYFGRAINAGDVVWVPAQVTATNNGYFAAKVHNADGSFSNISVNSGTSGQSTNPAEGDRPPR